MKKMKLKITSLLALTVLLIALLASCGEGKGNSGDGPGNAGKPSDSAVLKNGLDTAIVYDPNDFDKDTILSFGEDVYEVTSKVPDFIFDTTSKYLPEIVLGNSSRKITSDAQKRLNAMIKKEIRYSLDEDAAEEDLAGYTVYSDGESIAVIWSCDYGKDIAIDYFKENFLFGGEVCLEPGYSKTVIFSKTEYLAERADKMKAEAWAKLEEQLPDENSAEIIAAFKQLYSLYSSEIVVWMANLYDPAVGGFYYCPSARDNLRQALRSLPIRKLLLQPIRW